MCEYGFIDDFLNIFPLYQFQPIFYELHNNLVQNKSTLLHKRS